MDWVDRLERRVGFLTVPGLPGFLAGMTVAVGLLELFKPEFIAVLTLDPSRLLRGEVWRIVTFLFVPPPAGPLWLALWIALLYACLQALEAAWGDFRFEVFVAVGALACAAGGRATGAEFSNNYLILAAFLAFARLMPDRELLVLFVLPVKLRWLAALAAVWAALIFATAGLTGRVELLCGLSPYLLFHGPGHLRDLRWSWRRWRGGGR